MSYRLLLIDGNSEAITGTLIEGLTYIADNGIPCKAILQEEKDGFWEDVEPDLYLTFVDGELDDGIVWPSINGKKCWRPNANPY